MEKKTDASSNLLLCQEDKSCLNENEASVVKMGTDQSSHNTSQEYYDDDYIKLLAQKESLDANFGSTSCFDDSWVKDARFDATNWILKTQTQLGFRNQTAYLSVTYFDRFLSIRRIDEDKMWAIRLLSIACLSIAAKVEESKVPALSDYATEQNYRFDWQVIQKMELIVLSTIGWKMSLITPFAFVSYFIGRFSDDGSKFDEVLFGATELVMSVIKEIYLIEYRPSIIAAAAVLATIDWQLTQETLRLKIATVSLWGTSENQQQDQLISCYSIMQRLSPMNNLGTPNTTEVDQTMLASTSTTDVGAKRKLSFSDSDQQDPNLPEKISRR